MVTKGGERIEFTLDRGKRSRISLTVREGRLTVRVPMNFSAAQVRSFIEENLEWVHSTLGASEKRYGLPRRFEDGERIRLLGQELTVTAVMADRYFPPFIEDSRLKVAVCEDSSREYMQRQIQSFIYKLALAEISDSMKTYSAKMGLYPNKVTVKDLTASWGRCSSNGNISVNYKVVAYSKRHIDYVCIHELSHLRYMDHSRQFWDLVSLYCPDWKAIRDSMRT